MTTDDQELRKLIRQAVPRAGEPTPPADLWARLEQRLEARQTSLGKLDWLLAGLALGLILGFPEAVLLVLYHL